MRAKYVKRPKIYSGLVDKIGLLPPREVAGIVRAHLATRYAWRRIEGLNQSKRNTDGHVCIMPDRLADTGNEFGLASCELSIGCPVGPDRGS